MNHSDASKRVIQTSFAIDKAIENMVEVKNEVLTGKLETIDDPTQVMNIMSNVLMKLREAKYLIENTSLHSMV